LDIFYTLAQASFKVLLALAITTSEDSPGNGFTSKLTIVSSH